MDILIIMLKITYNAVRCIPQSHIAELKTTPSEGHLLKRHPKIKMQFSHLHFKHLNILYTSDELSQSNFFLQSPEKKNDFESSSKVRKISLGCNANTRIAFLFADAFKVV